MPDHPKTPQNSGDGHHGHEQPEQGRRPLANIPVALAGRQLLHGLTQLLPELSYQQQEVLILAKMNFLSGKC